MNQPPDALRRALDAPFSALDRTLRRPAPGLEVHEVGTVTSLGDGVARVEGLPDVRSEELLRLTGGGAGMAYDLDHRHVGVILLDHTPGLGAGGEATRTGRVMDVPVGEALLGRVVDPTGRPLDGRGAVRATRRLPVEREAPPIIDRAPVSVPVATGLTVVDALIPIGRGQRQLILGDRQTGKSSVALDTILNQRGTGVLCFYCAVGQRTSSVAKFVEELRSQGAMAYCTVVMASGDDPPGLQYLAPYAATSMAEHFMELGRDTLVVYDDLTAHARAYRELSLLLRRPPGREAYPGDIFYIHSRLLERATNLRRERGGGSLTALPIVETEAETLSAYIPTNVISITDGQIYLSPRLFRRGVLPAVDVGRSVSRVGGKTQLPGYRAVAGDLRLAYAQFEELEAFARFGTRLDDATRATLERGWRVRELLKQPRGALLKAAEQLAVLVALNAGLFDAVPLAEVRSAAAAVAAAALRDEPDVCEALGRGRVLDDAGRAALGASAKRALEVAASG